MADFKINATVIPPEYHGLRIDITLAQLFRDYSRSQLSQWLKEGVITVDKKIYKPKDKVFGGELIEFDNTQLIKEPEQLYSAEAIALNIVYEDQEILIINKPSGLIVHPGAGNPGQTLVNALVNHLPAQNLLPRAGIIHRLDKDTTGLLIVAKTLAAHTKLIRAMQAREIQRLYITLVQGHLISGGEIETFYGRHPRNRLKMAVREEGKLAVTRYALRKQFKDYSLLEVQLLTGRTHQIRVHMAHINHPVFGDPLYGGRMRFPKNANDKVKKILNSFHRQALHAFRLSFRHPQSEEILTFEAPLPDDFQILLSTLESYFV